MTARLFPSVCALVLLCVAAGVSAQTEEPAQVIQKALEEPAPVTSGDQPTPVRKSRIAPRRGGKVDVSEAARRLEQAQMARMQGLEPRAGEVIRAGGTQTLNYRYWQRQEKLRLAVEQAQRRCLDTQRHAAGRNVVRVSLGS